MNKLVKGELKELFHVLPLLDQIKNPLKHLMNTSNKVING